MVQISLLSSQEEGLVGLGCSVSTGLVQESCSESCGVGHLIKNPLAVFIGETIETLIVCVNGLTDGS